MAHEKVYKNYAEVIGRVAKIIQDPEKSKTGEMRFTIASHAYYTKKDGTKGEETQFLKVLVRPKRRFAKQSVVKVGDLLLVKGKNVNNSYQKEDGSWDGGQEINADAIKVLKKKGEGKVEDAATGEPIEIVGDTTEVEATEE